jgi:hypothetical protein
MFKYYSDFVRRKLKADLPTSEHRESCLVGDVSTAFSLFLNTIQRYESETYAKLHFILRLAGLLVKKICRNNIVIL